LCFLNKEKNLSLQYQDKPVYSTQRALSGLIMGQPKPTVCATREPYDRVARKEWNMIKTALSGKKLRNAVLIIGFAFLVAGCGGGWREQFQQHGQLFLVRSSPKGTIDFRFKHMGIRA
jgi:hypothetical protein